MSVPRLRISGSTLRRWLVPGIGVKRWLVIVFIGELCLALAGALLLRQFYREAEISGPGQAVVWTLTLQFLPYWTRALVVGVVGFGMTLLGVELGRKIGTIWGRRCELIGGIVLIFMGLYFLWPVVRGLRF